MYRRGLRSTHIIKSCFNDNLVECKDWKHSGLEKKPMDIFDNISAKKLGNVFIVLSSLRLPKS